MNFCRTKDATEAFEVVFVKSLFFDILNQFTTKQLEILLDELLLKNGTTCGCLFADVDLIFNKSKFLPKIPQNGQCRAVVLLKELLFHFFIFDFKPCQYSKTNLQKLVTFDDCDTSNFCFMTLPWCSCDVDAGKVCLNPFHSAVSHPSNGKILLSKDDIFFNESATTVTRNDLCSGDYNTFTSSSASCSTPCFYYLSYWERKNNIGRTVTVDNPLLLCYSDCGRKAAKCSTEKGGSPARQYCNLYSQASLKEKETLSSNVRSGDDLSRSLRQRIGRGFALYVIEADALISSRKSRTLCTADDSKFSSELKPKRWKMEMPWRLDNLVVLHNRGPCTLFVQSNFLTASLDANNNLSVDVGGRNEQYSSPAVPWQSVRLLPGHALIVQRIGFTKKSLGRAETLVDADTASVLISFSKYWGRNHKRTLITYCPCWIEVIFPVR